MVLKKSKYQKNTGNTLRKVCGCSSKGVARSAKRNAYIIKDEMTRWDEKVDQGRSHDLSQRPVNIPADLKLVKGVPASLNKKGHWAVTDQITSLEEKKGKKKKKKTWGKEWSDRGDGDSSVTLNVEQTTYTNNLKQPRKWRGVINDWDEDDEDSDKAYYSIEHPLYLSRNIHSDVYASKLNNVWSGYKKESVAKDKKKWYKDYIPLYEDEKYNLDGSDRVEWEEEENESLFDSPECIEVANSSQIEKSNDEDHSSPNEIDRITNSAPRAEHSVSFGWEGTNIEYDEYCEILKEIDSLNKQNPQLTNYETRCFAEKDQLKPDHLANHFKDFYSEGQCSPRRICLFDKEFTKNGRFVIISVFEEMEKTCDVNLKIFNISEHIVPYLNLYLAELDNVLPLNLVLDLCFHLDSLISRHMTKVITLPSCYVAPDQQRHVNALYPSELRSSSQVVALEDIWSCVVDKKMNEYVKVNSVDSFETVCNVCFSDESVTVFNPCGHYLCNDCWGNYISSKISCRSLVIACPERGCDLELDPIFIATYLNVDQMMIFAQKHCEAFVNHAPQMALCPRTSCNKVAVHDFNVRNIAVCSCKRTWCFGCGDKEHWPSSCEAFKSYGGEKKDKVEHEDDGTPIQNFVIMKMCPSCRCPIEKEGGCDHMTCICGQLFCWRCLTKLREEAQEHKCKAVNYIKVYFDNLNKLFVISKTNIAWTQKADLYEEERQKVKKYYNKVKTLSEHLDLNPQSARNLGKEEAFNRMRMQSISILMQCYKLLRNICIETAFRDNKYFRARSQNLIGKMLLPLLRLDQELSTTPTKSFDFVKTFKDATSYLQLLIDFSISWVKENDDGSQLGEGISSSLERIELSK